MARLTAGDGLVRCHGEGDVPVRFIDCQAPHVPGAYLDGVDCRLIRRPVKDSGISPILGRGPEVVNAVFDHEQVLVGPGPSGRCGRAHHGAHGAVLGRTVLVGYQAYRGHRRVLHDGVSEVPAGFVYRGASRVPGAHLDGVGPGLRRRPVEGVRRAIVMKRGPGCAGLEAELVLVAAGTATCLCSKGDRLDPPAALPMGWLQGWCWRWAGR